MKSRKQMKHAQLVSETINQIKTRFSTKVSDIKKCIDILLEKEYLERLDGDELGYLALARTKVTGGTFLRGVGLHDRYEHEYGWQDWGFI